MVQFRTSVSVFEKEGGGGTGHKDSSLPALLTRISMCPNCRLIRSNASAMDSSEAISMESGSAVEQLLGACCSNSLIASDARLESPRHPTRI